MNVKQIILFSMGPVGAAALGLLIIPALAWFFSAEEIGKLSIFQLAISFSIFFFSFGLDQAFVREYHDHENKAELFITMVFPGMASLVLAGVGVLISAEYFAAIAFGESSPFLVGLLYLCAVMGFLSNFLYTILRLEGRGGAYSASQLIPKVSILASIVLSFLFGAGGISNLFTIYVVAALILLFLLALLNANFLRKAIFSKFKKQTLGMVLPYAVPLLLNGIVYWWLVSLDKFFLRAYTTFSELGVYSMATSIAAAGIILQNIFSTIWAPTIYKMVSTGTVDYVLIGRVQAGMLLLVVLCFSLVGVLSPVIDVLLPGDYEMVKFILPACLAYPLFFTLTEATAIGVGVAKKTSFSLVAIVVAFVVSGTLNFILVPEYGARGAAVSLAIGFYIYLVLKTEFANRTWHRFPRYGIYISCFICLLLSTVQALMLDLNEYINYFWVLACMGIFLSYRSALGCPLNRSKE